MDAAVAALIGAAIGAAVPAGTTVMMHRATVRSERAARVFDHQREAYATFIVACQKYLDRAWAWWNDAGSPGRDGVEPEHMALTELYDLLTPTALYSTSAARSAARAAYDAISLYVHGTSTRSGGDASQYRAAEAAMRAFVVQASADLGVPA